MMRMGNIYFLKGLYSYVGLYLCSSSSMCQSLLMYYIYRQGTITANRENWYFFCQVLCFLKQLTVLQRELAEFHLSRWSGFTGFLCSECRQRGNWQAWGVPKLPKSGGLDFGDGTLECILFLLVPFLASFGVLFYFKLFSLS